MLVLPFRDHSYVRFISTRTGETLLELKMLGSAVIVWGAHHRTDETDVRLAEDGATVSVWGRVATASAWSRRSTTCCNPAFE